MAYLQSSVYETKGRESGACGVAIGTVSEKGKYVYVIYDTTVCSPTLSWLEAETVDQYTYSIASRALSCRNCNMPAKGWCNL